MVDFNQMFTGFAEPSPGTPPKDEEELQSRKSGWVQFANRVKEDPRLQMAFVQMGMQLLQPRQAGQTEGQHILQGLGSGVQFLGRAAAGQEQQRIAEEERQRKTGLEERQLGLRERQEASRAGLAERRFGLDERQLEQQRRLEEQRLGLQGRRLGTEEAAQRSLADYRRQKLELDRMALQAGRRVKGAAVGGKQWGELWEASKAMVGEPPLTPDGMRGWQAQVFNAARALAPQYQMAPEDVDQIVQSYLTSPLRGEPPPPSDLGVRGGAPTAPQPTFDVEQDVARQQETAQAQEVERHILSSLNNELSSYWMQTRVATTPGGRRATLENLQRFMQKEEVKARPAMLERAQQIYSTLLAEGAE